MTNCVWRWVAVVGFAAAIFIAALSPASAFAATLSFAPATKTVTQGEIFSVVVDVSSANQSMNAASGEVSFPSGKLRVLSVSTGNSAMSLWVQNPSFSNAPSGGVVDFAGVVLNPGFTGIDGRVVTVQFQAVGLGDAPLSFSSGSVLANDGNGTNILQSLGTADITIVPAPPAPAVSTTTTAVTPASTTPATSIAPVCPTVPSSTPAVTVNGWFGATTQLLLAWAAVILLGLLLVAAITALAYYLIHRLRRFRVSLSRQLVQERKELREDLKRIEKELDADRSENELDLSPSGVRKRQDRLHKEIEHFEDDIKRGLKDED